MTRRAARGLLAIALPAACLPVRALGAQALPDFRIEGGYARVEQAGDTSRSATSAAILTAFWRRPGDGVILFANGNLTLGRDSLAAATGAAALSIPWNVDERVRTEGGVAASTFQLRNTGSGGNANGYIRQHVVTEDAGFWAGMGFGRTFRESRNSYTSESEIGLWGRYSVMYGSVSYARHRSSDFILLRAAGTPSDPSASRYLIDDIELAFEARGGPNTLGFSWVMRRGLTGTDFTDVAASMSGLLQIADRVAVTATYGRQLLDPLRGLPQADLVTTAVRFSFGPKPLPVMQRSAIARATVDPAPAGGGELEIRVFAADTMSVQVAGDFSEWRPLPLKREAGTFVARVRLPPGKFRIAVRVGDGPWRAPRNLARVRDDYGGEAGLLVIP